MPSVIRSLRTLLGSPRELRALGLQMLREWRDDRVSGLAAEIAFWAVLSMVPSALVVSAALGFVEPIAGAQAAEEIRADVLDWVGGAFGDDSGAVDAVEELFGRSSAGVLTVGVLGALWTASRGFGALIRGLDVVYDLEERRTWLGVRAMALLLATGSLLAAATLLGMIVFGPLFGTASEIGEAVGLGGAVEVAWRWIRIPFVVVVMTLWAATVFHIAPNHRSPWRWDLPGAVLTTVLWMAGTVGFRLYVGLTGGGNAVIGVLGGVLTLLLWTYVMTVAVLVGGELNAVLAQRFGVGDRDTPEHRIRNALAEWARRRLGRRQDEGP